MPRSGRHLLAALAGLAALFTVFGIGVMLGAGSSDSEKQRYQSYRYAADKPLDLDPTAQGKANPQALEDREPCQKPKGSGESDLCAQWRAAYAGEQSAFWAQWSFWITAAGILGLVATVIQTRIALNRAQDANDIARSASNMQLRAHLVVEQFYWNGSYETGVQFGVWWKNSGSTTTVNFRSFVNFILTNEPIADDFDFPVIDAQITTGHAGPGSHPFMSAAAPNFSAGLPAAVMDAVDEKQVYLYVYGWAKYFDVFDPLQEHITKFCCMPYRATDASGKKVFFFRMHERHNCADEGCAQ